MFGMLKRGFRPAAKPAAAPAASPAMKVAPKGKTQTYRSFTSGHLKGDSKRKKRLVGTDKVFVIDEDNDVFRVNQDGSYVRKRIELEGPVERDQRTGRVTKTTTYGSTENALAAMLRQEGGTLRRETGDHGVYAPKHGTWAGKEHDQKIEYRSKEELASLDSRVKLRKVRLGLDKARGTQELYGDARVQRSKERMNAIQPGRREALFTGPKTPPGWTPPPNTPPPFVGPPAPPPFVGPPAPPPFVGPPAPPVIRKGRNRKSKAATTPPPTTPPPVTPTVTSKAATTPPPTTPPPVTPTVSGSRKSFRLNPVSAAYVIANSSKYTGRATVNPDGTVDVDDKIFRTEINREAAAEATKKQTTAGAAQPVTPKPRGGGNPRTGARGYTGSPPKKP